MIYDAVGTAARNVGMVDYNPWFVTAQQHGDTQKTFPLSAIDLKMIDQTWGELMLIYRPYY